MVSKVTDIPGVAGVECPKKTGEMDKDTSCRECPYYSKCFNAIMDTIGAKV